MGNSGGYNISAANSIQISPLQFSIHDSLQNAIGQVNIGLSYGHEVTEEDRELLKSLGFEINVELPVVNALLLVMLNLVKFGS